MCLTLRSLGARPFLPSKVEHVCRVLDDGDDDAEATANRSFVLSLMTDLMPPQQCRGFLG